MTFRGSAHAAVTEAVRKASAQDLIHPEAFADAFARVLGVLEGVQREFNAARNC